MHKQHSKGHNSSSSTAHHHDLEGGGAAAATKAQLQEVAAVVEGAFEAFLQNRSSSDQSGKGADHELGHVDAAATTKDGE